VGYINVAIAIILLGLCYIVSSLFCQNLPLINGVNVETLTLSFQSIALLFNSLAWPLVIVIFYMLFKDTLSTALINLSNGNFKLNKNGLEYNAFIQKNASIETSITDVSSSKNSVLLEQTNSASSANISDEKNFTPTPLVKHYIEILKPQFKTEQKNLQIENYEYFLEAKSAEMYIAWHFEKIYATIYGSQIKALQFLISNGNKSSKTIIYNFYNGAKELYPNLYSTYMYENWLSYMQSQHLILINGENIELTMEGHGFINYIFHHDYSTFKYY